MIETTLENIQKNYTFLNTEQIIHIVSSKEKKDIGYFVPNNFRVEFEKFIKNLEKKKKIELLKRVAIASKQDPIGDGTVGDGIL